MTSVTWPIGAVTLFEEDLERARSFYETVFGLAAVYEDENSAVYPFGETVINLLRVSEADQLISPRGVASPSAGARCQFTVEVDDVDATCEALAAKGVALLNGPVDRPWGIRTAAVVDPGGHVWEFAGPVAT